MRRVPIVLFAVLFTTSAFAGITYQFKTTSEGIGGHAMSGIVRSEAGKSRIEITASDEATFPAGSVILSSGGGAMTVFEPSKKTYYEMDIEKYIQQTAGLAATKASPLMKIDFSNPHTSIRDEGPGEAIEGYPTRHATVDTSFQMIPNVTGMAQALKMAVHTTTQIWLTDKLPADAANILQTSRLQTGIPAIDKIVESTSSLKGFPLKQVTTSSVSINEGDPMTSTTTSIVSNIRTVNVASSQFALPAGYTKVDDPLKAMMKKLGLE